MKIKVTSLLLVFLLLFSLNSSAFAVENDGVKCLNEWEIEILPYTDNAMLSNEKDIVIKGGDADLWHYRKKDVVISYEWTGYYRVSDNLKTGECGGSISCNESVTVSASITGGNPFVNIIASGSASSEIGYTLNVGPNKRVYMGYRVYNKVERGTWEKYNKVTGIVVESQQYEAISPQYGEYALLITNRLKFS